MQSTPQTKPTLDLNPPVSVQTLPKRRNGQSLCKHCNDQSRFQQYSSQALEGQQFDHLPHRLTIHLTPDGVDSVCAL